MPRERKGSILSRDGKLYARVQFTDESGKRRDITRKAESRTHARQIIRQLLKEIESSTPKQLDAVNMTFRELADYYTNNYLHEAIYVGDKKVSGVGAVMKRTISEKHFAEICGLSYGYVKALRRQGAIKHLRAGRKVLYLYPERVEDFLKVREHRPAQ